MIGALVLDSPFSPSTAMTFEDLLRMTVPVGPGCVAPEGTPMSPDFRIAVQRIDEKGVHIIVHPFGYSGETLDFIVSGNELQASLT